ncbi:MAG: hypothetical protein Q7T30_02400 [Planctomycetota bacterium]|nr:hypothetical protein [Planctomycetota bacterium]
MASSSFRDNLTRALSEARDQADSHEVGILLDILRLLDDGRYAELPDRIAQLRPIFRARVGSPPTRAEDRDGGKAPPGQWPDPGAP